MPKVGPGNDNITGDRYTLDLGVEPDLGNLLQNLQVANDLLDQAEQRFRTINDVVGSTTQRLAQATRQTELLAAQTQRLQNSYQSIASSGMTLAQIGAGAMGGGFMPGMMPFMPGQMAFQGMPPAASYARPSQMMQALAPGQREEVMPFRAPPPATTHLPGSVRLAAWEQIAEHSGLNKGTGTIGSAIQRFKAGYKAPGKDWARGTQAAVAGGEIFGTQAEAEAAKFAPEEITLAGRMGGLGAATSRVMPYAAAVLAGYKLVAGQLASARRYTGITGGTGVFGGVGGGSIELGVRARMMGLLAPGIDYGGLQEQALGAGYTDQGPGGMYETARNYLYEAAKRGMSEVIDQVDLFQEVVEKGGGSVANLTDAMDTMQAVAKDTNASLTIMAQNFKANIETLTGMGLGGAGAAFAGTIQATAWAGATVPGLRAYGGPDLSNLYLQARLAQMNNVPFTALPGYLAGAIPGGGGVPPGMQGIAAPAQMEELARQQLLSMGFNVGDDTDAIYQNDAMLRAAQNVMVQMGYVPAEIAADYATFVPWIEGMMQEGGTPAKQAVAAQLEAAKGVSLGAALKPSKPLPYGVTSPGQAALASGDRAGAAGAYVQGLGLEVDQAVTTGNQAIAGTTPATEHPVGQWYANWLAGGGTTIPALKAIIDSGDAAIASTFVQLPDGGVKPLWEWLQNMGDAAGPLLQSGKAQLASANKQQREYMRRDPKTGLMEAVKNPVGFQVSDLGFESSLTYLNEKPQKNQQSVIRIAEDQFERMRRWLE